MAGGHPHQEIAAKSESLVKAFNVDTDILSFEETSTLYKEQDSLITAFSQKKMHCTL